MSELNKTASELMVQFGANAATDIEFDFPIGFKEVEGIHSRTDFDLSQHQKFSGKKMQYFESETDERFIPYVVETSIGLDRTFLMVLSHAFHEEMVPDANGKLEERILLKLAPVLAPVKLAILPLVKKDGLPEIGMKIFNELKFKFNCKYEEKDSIGRRYRRQDAIGTPFCITVDHQTTQDETVTIRYRDSMKQERIKLPKLETVLTGELSFKKLLQSLQ